VYVKFSSFFSSFSLKTRPHLLLFPHWYLNKKKMHQLSNPWINGLLEYQCIFSTKKKSEIRNTYLTWAMASHSWTVARWCARTQAMGAKAWQSSSRPRCWIAVVQRREEDRGANTEINGRPSSPRGRWPRPRWCPFAVRFCGRTGKMGSKIKLGSPAGCADGLNT
jgi:hypothetical protein